MRNKFFESWEEDFEDQEEDFEDQEEDFESDMDEDVALELAAELGEMTSQNIRDEFDSMDPKKIEDIKTWSMEDKKDFFDNAIENTMDQEYYPFANDNFPDYANNQEFIDRFKNDVASFLFDAMVDSGILDEEDAEYFGIAEEEDPGDYIDPKWLEFLKSRQGK